LPEVDKSAVSPVDSLVERITSWAVVRPDILALAMVGSYARGIATDTSDIDFILITFHPDAFLKDLNWMIDFGRVENFQIENYGLVTSVRIWYAGGLEVEIGITDERWVAEPLDAGTIRVIDDGIRILFERKNILSCHLLIN
jgi:predicted nucleotidyltransferase